MCSGSCDGGRYCYGSKKAPKWVGYRYLRCMGDLGKSGSDNYVVIFRQKLLELIIPSAYSQCYLIASSVFLFSSDNVYYENT